MNDLENALQRAAEVISNADALLIGAGAGMGVDSGLPDFRGTEGFWRAYPPFRGRRFEEMSNPVWFERDVNQAWGFFGHRLHLYRSTTPHEGFAILRKWAERKPLGYFIFTSNVDGQFQAAGFDPDRILECHGSIHFLQCVAQADHGIWPAEGIEVQVDESTFRAHDPLPRCPRCDSTARPNILMFGDYGWLENRTAGQEQRYIEWSAAAARGRLAVVELGAGLAVPTVRFHCERTEGELVRINPRDTEVPAGAISIPLGALDALTRIYKKKGDAFIFSSN
ncbi:MAG: NAD-dependent deacetylase [Gammaproteobacteria bacterium]|nr:NAD-dependent deacetylase [Gammaproteobacteria bacterium]